MGFSNADIATAEYTSIGSFQEQILTKLQEGIEVDSMRRCFHLNQYLCVGVVFLANGEQWIVFGHNNNAQEFPSAIRQAYIKQMGDRGDQAFHSVSLHSYDRDKVGEVKRELYRQSGSATRVLFLD